MLESELVGLDGGSRRLCLEFANTVAWHAGERPEDRLRSYADLVGWARGAGLVTGQQARRLLLDAAENPGKAGRALRRAAGLREAVYRIFVALIREKQPQKGDMAELNDVLAKTAGGARVVETAGGFSWSWNVKAGAGDRLIWPIAFSAARLLVSAERSRVGQCADDRGCGWLFFDTSKNRSRRWCDINDCGNRAKQRRHYKRGRARTP
jgi:predicted RNA-binding Zn ribbon-like protein